MLDNDYDDEDGEREGSRMQTKLKSSQMKKFNNYQTKPPHLHPCTNTKMRVGGGRDSRRATKPQRERERETERGELTS